MFALQLKNILQISNNRKVLRIFFYNIFSGTDIFNTCGWFIHFAYNTSNSFWNKYVLIKRECFLQEY